MSTLLQRSAWTRFCVVLAISFCFVVPLAHASSTTQLFSEDFSQMSWPPTGWTDQTTNANNLPGWIATDSGYGGLNGAILCDFWDGATGNLLTPIIDASAYSAVGDTAFLDFDLFFEFNNYNSDNGSAFDDNLYVLVQSSGITSQILSLSTTTDYTYLNSSYNFIMDPLTDPSAWRHYHIGIPAGYRAADLQIIFDGERHPGWGLSNCAVDNVVVTGTHFYRINYTPKALTFPETLVTATSVSQTVLVSNTTPLTVDFSNFQIIGPGFGDFTLTHSFSSLQPGSDLVPSIDSLVITFSPTQPGSRTAVLSFDNTSDSPTGSINLSGTGIVPIVSVSPTTLFNKTRTKLGSYIDQYVLVNSLGRGPVVVKSASFLSGDYPGEYSIIQIPSSPIAVGQSDTLWVRYHPTIEGSRPAILNVVTNAWNGAQQVILKGIGTLGRLVITPNNLNFDSIQIGAKQCRDITLYNAGTDTVLITGNFFSSADADFVLTPVTGTDTILPPDKSRNVTVCFTPIRNGIRQARLRIMTNIPMTFEEERRDTSAFFVDIVGEGVPVGNLSVLGTAIVDSTIIGQQICRTDTFYNQGSADITITGAKITGTTASEYTISGVTFPLVVRAGASQVFTICATPTQRGDRAAMLELTASSNGKGFNAKLPIDIFGQQVCANASPTVAFESKTCVGTTDTAWVTVTNCGDVTTSYTASISVNGRNYAIVGAATSAIVGAAGRALFPIVFTPTDRTPQNATLTITANTGAVTQTVSLNGVGQAATIAGNATADSTRVASTSTFALKVTNAGECDWTPGTPTFSDPNFVYVSGGTANIPSGGTGTLTLSFSPTSGGLHTSTVTFANATGTSIPAAAVSVTGFALPQVGVAKISEANGYSLKQNYPNPFNPTTEIRFVLAKEGTVTMNVIDITGKIVRNVLNERMSAGEHSTVVNASELTSGVYYYQLIAGSTVLTRQMVLSK